MTFRNKIFQGLKFSAQQIAVVVTAIGCADLIGCFYSATGESMLPSIQPNSVVFVDSISKYFTKYKKGDIVIVQSLHDENSTICKRIIHTEGDEFNLKNGRKIKLKKRQVWVEGDNKNNSYDSRNFGPVSDYLIIGKVKFTLFPYKKYFNQ